MPTARAYMMSLLVVRRLTLGREFPNKFANAWFLWEPGQWQPSSGSTPTRVASADSPPDRPPSGDALCYELPAGKVMKVGRSPDCDIQINDATVSREHLQLEPLADGRWCMRTLSSTSSTALDGQPVRLNELRELKPRMALKLGDVTVTFHDGASFVGRLDEVIARSKGP